MQFKILVFHAYVYIVYRHAFLIPISKQNIYAYFPKLHRYILIGNKIGEV